jgi:acyl-[acyl-carrier-protein]-phospholipid O-acyltransferase / long-chain-fatty-acid--[acyl-carrier-protein] ligase
MVKELMTSRRFAALFWTQFFTALNDNFAKNALVILIVFSIEGSGGGALATLAGVILMAPFFVLSALGGELADKYDKALVARRLKFAEIFVAGVAAAGFAFQSVPILMASLGLFGTISALFGPIKYGILPDHLKTKELSAGNALIESGTFAAILLGTIAGGLAAGRDKPPSVVAFIVMGVAIACWLSARMIPATGAAAPDLVVTRNPWTSTSALIRDLKSEKRLWDGTLIVSWFWLAGAVALSLLPSLVEKVVGGVETVFTLCLMVFAIGVAVGSGLAARASQVRPNLAVVPIGGFIMSLFMLALAWSAYGVTRGSNISPLAFAASANGFHILIDLFGIAVGGGMFVVPSFAAVQAWAAPERRARVIAAVNVISAAFIVVSGVAVAGLQLIGLSIAVIFALLGALTLIVTGLVMKTWGREGVRDVGGFIFKLLFRVEIRGLENLPQPGTRMIIAPNHVSLLDGPLLHSVLPIDAAFAVDTGIATAWYSKPFMAMIRAYKIDPARPLATRHLVNLVKSGEPLVIFPEGRLTVTGSLMKVYDGAGMIADKGDAFVVPVRIEGAQRSTLSYMKDTQIKKSWFPKITVTFLPPVKLTIDPALRGKARRIAAGAALQDVMIDAMVLNTTMEQTLFEGLASAHRNRDAGRFAVEDPLSGGLTYRKLILGAQVLSGKLEQLTSVGEYVGVLLPNSNGVAATFFALQTIGRVPAMLNFSAGAVNVRAACTAAQVKVVLTSRAFVEKGRLDALIAALEADVKIVYLDELRLTIGVFDKLRGLRAGSRQRVFRKSDDPAVVLFTSGSEGTPKGVVLSHRNILANAAQALSRVDANGEDKVFNALPVFHSFGLTGGLMMPLLAGIPVYLYPSPLHYRIVPELIYQTNSTILFGTDTFLAGYARSAHAYDFRALRMVLAGAEAVKERTRALYLSRFGVRILEGYGVTETSPVLAMNTPMANKPGTVGRLSPLMESRLEPVPGIEEGGRLFVRGPNVMLGYLRSENPGVIEPPEGGWHDTGDIVIIDAEGFISIKGRAKRFAKIAGEMISLSAVEAMAAALWPQSQSIVVTVPDDRKGERLVLITSERDAAREAMQKQAKAAGASELSAPSYVMVVDKLPLLGTGKVDYVAASAMARERFGEVRQVA